MDICIFGSGKCEPDSELYKKAMELGECLGKNGINIVSGGYNGVMEAVCKGSRFCDNEKTGVVIQGETGKSPNPFNTRIIKTNDYIERLQCLIKLGEAYVFFEGGSGTFLEFSAVWALTERGIIPERPVILTGDKWGMFIRDFPFNLNMKLYATNSISDVTNILTK